MESLAPLVARWTLQQHRLLIRIPTIPAAAASWAAGPRWAEVAQLIEDGVLIGGGSDDGAGRPFVDFTAYTIPWTQENIAGHGVLAAFASGKPGRLVPIGSDGTDSVIALYRPSEAEDLDEATVIYLSSEGGDPEVVAADLDDFIVLVSLGWSPFGLAKTVTAAESDRGSIPQPVEELRSYVRAHLLDRDRSFEDLLASAVGKRNDLPL